MLRTLFRLQSEEEIYFFIADLHHIRLVQAPEHLFPGLLQILPKRLSQVGIKGNQVSCFLCDGHGHLGSGTGRLVRQRQRTEVKHPGSPNDLRVDFLRSQAGIRTGLSGEGEFPFSLFIQGHKGQSGKHAVIHHHGTGVNARFPEGLQKQPAEGIVSHLAHESRFAAELSQGRQKVCRRAAGMGYHGGIALFVHTLTGKINEQFAQRNHIQHCFRLFPPKGLRLSHFPFQGYHTMLSFRQQEKYPPTER